MNKQDILRLFKEKERLEKEIERLKQANERIDLRYIDTENELKKIKKSYKNSKKKIYEIAMTTFPREYIDLDLNNSTQEDVYEFVLNKINEVQNEAHERKIEMIELKENLNDTKGKIAKSSQNSEMDMSELEPEAFEFPEDEINYDDINLEELGEEEEILLLDTIVDDISDSEKDVLLSIAKGKTSFSDIRDDIEISSTSLSENNTSLQEKALINFKSIRTGGRGRPTHHYFLTALGENFVNKKLNNDVVTTKIEKMSTHGSADHGGLIVNVGEYYESTGWEVEYDGSETTFKLNNGKEIRFDLKTINKETNEIRLIETERAKCHKSHLFEKFDKFHIFVKEKYSLPNKFYFISPTKDSLRLIEQALFEWIRKNKELELYKNKKDKAIIIFCLATIENMKNDKYKSFAYGNTRYKK